MLAIEEAYEDVIGRKMPRFAKEEIQAFIADGMEPKMVLKVIEYTACAPRPSWAYARAVLYRNAQSGILTAFDFGMSLAKRGRDGDSELPY